MVCSQPNLITTCQILVCEQLLCWLIVLSVTETLQYTANTVWEIWGNCEQKGFELIQQLILLKSSNIQSSFSPLPFTDV